MKNQIACFHHLFKTFFDARRETFVECAELFASSLFIDRQSIPRRFQSYSSGVGSFQRAPDALRATGNAFHSKALPPPSSHDLQLCP